MIYEVGKKVCAPSMGGVVFDIADSGGILVLQYSHPTRAEIKAFKKGMEIKFVVVDDIIFILFRLAGMQWQDAPYNRALSRNLTSLPDIKDGEGLSIHVLLVDASTGVLVAQKLFSPSTEVSRKLVDAVRRQPEIPDYDRRLIQIYNKYPTNALVAMAE